MKINTPSILQRAFSKLTPSPNQSKVKKIGLEALKGLALVLLCAGFGALTLASHGMIWLAAGAALGGSCGLVSYTILRLRHSPKPTIIP